MAPSKQSSNPFEKRVVKVCGLDPLVPLLALCALTGYWPWLSGAWMVAFWAVFFRDRWPAPAQP